jgi:hypothetical protein
VVSGVEGHAKKRGGEIRLSLVSGTPGGKKLLTPRGRKFDPGHAGNLTKEIKAL